MRGKTLMSNRVGTDISIQYLKLVKIRRCKFPGNTQLEDITRGLRKSNFPCIFSTQGVSKRKIKSSVFQGLEDVDFSEQFRATRT